MKNKEPIILLVVVFFSLTVYGLVETYAHHVLHKHVESKNYIYDGTDDIESIENTIAKLESDKTNKDKIIKAKDEATDLEKAEAVVEEEVRLKNITELIVRAKARLEKKVMFFADVKRIASMEGNTTAGEASFANCISCHYDGANTNGVLLPDITRAGVIYNKNYLIGIIKDPAIMANVDHNFNENNPHPMDSVKYMVSSDEDIANVVAYMIESAPKEEDITPKMAYENACGRCHALEYENFTQLGATPTFKHKKDALAHEIKVIEYEDSLRAYMGKLPPDLSMYIRSRSETFLLTFMENPQNHMEGTSMPRVGVTAEVADKIIEHMKDAGDTKRLEREEIGMYVMIYIVIFAIFALLWKKQVWRDLH